MDYDLVTRPSIVAFTALILLSIAYLTGLAVYRLYLSPLARFPGPKLAALSQWYEMYYDVVLQGQFIFRIQEMHKKYGPIVRITPFELHVEDSDYWDELYSRSARYDKYVSGRFGAETMVFTTTKSDLHAIRRAPLNPMFSKRSIAKFEPFIKEKLEIMCNGFVAAKESGDVINIIDAFSAFTGDVVMEYCFGFCDNNLESPGFSVNFHKSLVILTSFGNFAVQFPIIHPILKMIPDSITEKLTPDLHLILVLRKTLRDKIIKILNGDDKSYTKSQHPTIFHELIESNLPSQEKSLDRLDDEALNMLGAGLATTSWALVTTSFHLINNPIILQKLRTELEAAIPDPSAELDTIYLEKLPYLSACIQEGIRLSYGLSARNPRVSPHKATEYKDWKIPAGTPVSMTIVDVHHDEHVYPHSRSFIPERWLDNPRTKKGEPLNRYFVAFGKGTRACLGINLAHAEIYLAIATLFRRFQFELYETDISDLEMKHDFFLPVPKLDSKGLRVKITSATS